MLYVMGQNVGKGGIEGHAVAKELMSRSLGGIEGQDMEGLHHWA